MTNNVRVLPITKSEQWRQRMADALREYADIIEHDLADPPIESVILMNINYHVNYLIRLHRRQAAINGFAMGLLFGSLGMAGLFLLIAG